MGFHYPWDVIWEENPKEDDPNYLSKRIIGRPMDINIGIYNPKFNSTPRGDYDLIIKNPNSKQKKFLKKSNRNL